jgi:prevent-host-death family protein
MHRQQMVVSLRIALTYPGPGWFLASWENVTRMTKMTNTAEKGNHWTVADAKAKLSHLIEQAQAKGPQTITKHGVAAAVVVSVEEWNRKTKRTGNLTDFFAASPLRDSGLEIRRKKDRPQKVVL